MTRRPDATDEQWEGLAEVVPLRSSRAWPSWPNHRALPDEEFTEPVPRGAGEERQRRFVVVRVRCFADAREIADHLVAQVPVLLDLSDAEVETAMRIVDFSSGVVFGLGCAMHRVDKDVFLLAPAGTEVEGAARETDVGVARS